MLSVTTTRRLPWRARAGVVPSSAARSAGGQPAAGGGWAAGGSAPASATRTGCDTSPRSPSSGRSRRACVSPPCGSSASWPWLCRLPGNEACRDRQLVGGQSQRLAGDVFAHARNLEEHAAGPDHGHPELHRPFAAALSGLRRLLGNRLVREDADPELAAAAHEARDRAARGFGLAGAEPAGPHGLQAVVTKGDGVAGLGASAPPAAVHLAVLGALRL